ncbi:hypothetical protein [Sphingobium yanoikuyae]|uniref:hypothetical protein n=1 Tax=Sphingobium yanoikuyae TaxID=13690 RepID=UPI00242B8DE8|nr:hypothetical protein [Sphingobium yanoikuyae]
MRAFVLMLALVSTPAMAADQFDLICQGRARYGAPASWQKFENRYRVDLAAKRWCRDNCERVMPLADVSEARITFTSIHNNASIGDVDHFVERSSGRLVEIMASRYSPTTVEAQCEAAPFSGLPDKKF